MTAEPICMCEALLFGLLARHPTSWLSTAHLGRKLFGFKKRTIQKHAKRLVDLGVIERRWVFARYYYRALTNPSADSFARIAELRGWLDGLRVTSTPIVPPFVLN